MKKIISNIFNILSANIIIFILGLFTSFLLPYFLTIKDYSIYRTYFLFLNIIGITHLGFTDGLYLKYGGKSYDKINEKIFSYDFYFLTLEQIIIFLILLSINIIFKNNMLFILIIFTILPYHLINLFITLYQSTFKFNYYIKINIIKTFLNTITIIILFFIFKIFNSLVILSLLIFIMYILSIYIIIKEKNKLKYFILKQVINKDKISTIKIGIFILIGNLSLLFFFTIDQWFVKLFYSTEKFAFYSFAISMMYVIMLIINSVSMTFYPYFAKDITNIKWFESLKKIILIVGILGIGSYFVFDVIVRWYLSIYVQSLDIIQILFFGFPMIGVINSIYINIYKAFKKERVYFFTVLIMLMVSIITNVIALVLFHTMEAIAIATTVTFFIWYVFSSFYKKFLRIDLREYLLIAGYIMTFYMSYILGEYVGDRIGGYVIGSIVGMITYYTVIGLMIHVYDRQFYKQMWNLLVEQVRGLRNGKPKKNPS